MCELYLEGVDSRVCRKRNGGVQKLDISEKDMSSIVDGLCPRRHKRISREILSDRWQKEMEKQVRYRDEKKQVRYRADAK